MWKEAAEHNTQAAKLFAEKSELQVKVERMQEEIKQSPESMTAQIRSLAELNESLNTYLKAFCEESKNEVDRELAQAKIELAENIESYSIKFTEIQRAEQQRKEYYENREIQYKQTIEKYKREFESVEAQFLKERDELQKIITNLKEDFNQTKDDQQRDVQMLKVALAEKDAQIISL